MGTILTGIFNLEEEIEGDRNHYDICVENVLDCLKIGDVDLTKLALETLEHVINRIEDYKTDFKEHGIECNSYNQLLEHINSKRWVVLKAKLFIASTKIK